MADEAGPIVPPIHNTIQQVGRTCATCGRIIGPEEHVMFGDTGGPYCSTDCMLGSDAYGTSIST